MHVGLNLIYLVPGETGGMDVVARELIPAVRRAAPDLRLTAFVNREAAEIGEGPWVEEIPSVVVPVRARRRVEWVRGEQQLLPPLAKRHGVELVHSLASTAPGWGGFRRIVTIHDLIYRFYPEAHSGVLSLGMRVLVRLAAKRSHRVIADSLTTRDDLVRLLRVPADRVDVVPLGVGRGDGIEPAPEGELRARYELGSGPLALSVSAKRPHKNLPRLLEALALTPAEGRPVLVVPGYTTWHHERALRDQAAQAGLQHHVRFLSWVPERDLGRPLRRLGVLRLPVPLRGFRTPGARGHAARPTGRVFRSLLAARGRRRRGAHV